MRFLRDMEEDFSPFSSLYDDALEQLQKKNQQQRGHVPTKYTSFLLVENAHLIHGLTLFVGSETGQIFFFFPHSLHPKQESLVDGVGIHSHGHGHTSKSPDEHVNEVLCLMHSTNTKLSPSFPLGLIFSGSRDRTIKVWNFNVKLGRKVLLQTLVGHSGGVTDIKDACDGTFFSSSVDGTFKMWQAQRNREILLNPFFECCANVCINKTLWVTTLVVNPLPGAMTLYVGDSGGNIELYRKGGSSSSNGSDPKNSNNNSNGMQAKSGAKGEEERDTEKDKAFIEGKVASFTGQLRRHKKWECVHELGISKLLLVPDERLLVSLSSDCSCKIICSELGQTFYCIENPNVVVYTGVMWEKRKSSFFLVDELGNFYSSIYFYFIELCFHFSFFNHFIPFDSISPIRRIH